MEAITGLLNQINSIVWGAPMLVILFGVGLYLTVGLRFMPIKNIGYGFKQLSAGRQSTDDGDITPYQALMTALSATIGTGNIAGVATAIFLGGPGAVFWMWMMAIVGMATKFGEAVLAVKYREIDEKGNHVGGPMYYIKNGLGDNWKWLAFLFALFGMIAAFGIGNMVQSNSVADAMQTTFNMPERVTGLIIALAAAAVILGGVRRIAEVASTLVPLMAVSFVACALYIIMTNIGGVPSALSLIVEGAFNGTAATGGFAGAAVWAALRFGVARGVFSNEAGLGSAPIAHAAAKTNDPVKQGIIAMLGTFIDTIIVCTMTALAIILTGAWTSGENGAALSTLAFSQGIPGGGYVIGVALSIFAFTTVIGWSYYGERCATYIFGTRITQVYRVLWIIAILIGAEIKLNFVWLLSDTMNAMMALPNLIALVLLSPVIFKITKDYFSEK